MTEGVTGIPQTDRLDVKLPCGPQQPEQAGAKSVPSEKMFDSTEEAANGQRNLFGYSHIGCGESRRWTSEVGDFSHLLRSYVLFAAEKEVLCPQA